MKIENEEQLAETKLDLKSFERWVACQVSANELRAAIAEYERNRDDARVAEIAAGLSDKAKARLIFLGTGENSSEAVTDACRELRGKHLEEFPGATPLGLKVLAELQNVKPPVGCKYEIVLHWCGKAQSRGLFFDKEVAEHVMACLSLHNTDCKYSIREL